MSRAMRPVRRDVTVPPLRHAALRRRPPASLHLREARRVLLPEVLDSWPRERRRCDIVVVEGAGSPAEINLRSGDIANMGFARAAGVPVVLVGDIDRGGVIASLVGTRAVTEASSCVASTPHCLRV